jgi:opacity protein-like surface antigen
MNILPFVAAVSLAAVSTAAAQDPPPTTTLSHGDVHFVVGWQNIRKPPPQQQYNEWLNAILYGGAGVGWYWTDHLKTQVDFGAGTEGHQYRYQVISINGQTTNVSSQLAVRRQRMAIAQHYQFFRNRWFHPYVGAGADITRETATEQFNFVLVYDSVTRTSREIAPPRTEGPNHSIIVRPFATVGFKAYMTQRAFFMADSRVVFEREVDELLFRVGFGVDF